MALQIICFKTPGQHLRNSYFYDGSLIGDDQIYNVVVTVHGFVLPYAWSYLLHHTEVSSTRRRLANTHLQSVTYITKSKIW